MYLEIPNFLSEGQCLDLRSIAKSGQFQNGLTTAKHFTQETKKNEQLNPTTSQSTAIDALLKTAYQSNAEIQAFTQATELRAPILSRYQPGMKYERHLDAPFLLTNTNMRTDLSMTVFLSTPDSYDGGALILETEYGDIDCKPSAGTAIVYSTLLWHEVEEVTRGSRLAIVSWFQSRIRDPIQRATLYDITMAWQDVAAAAPDSEAARRLKRTMMNMTRLWSES